jgi:hypothetical protein
MHDSVPGEVSRNDLGTEGAQPSHRRSSASLTSSRGDPIKAPRGPGART